MILKNAGKNQPTRCRDQSWAQESSEPVALDRNVRVLPKPSSESVATNGHSKGKNPSHCCLLRVRCDDSAAYLRSKNIPVPTQRDARCDGPDGTFQAVPPGI